MRVALQVINLNLSDIFTTEYVKIPIRVIPRHYHHLEKILKFPLNSSNSSSASSFGVENILLFTFFSFSHFLSPGFFVLGCAHPSLNINKNEAAAANMYVKVNVNVSISEAATVVEDDDP